MKTVDNAFLRAYNRQSFKAGAPSTEVPSAVASNVATQTVEELYSEGTWYRVDSPETPPVEFVSEKGKVTETAWYDPPWGARSTPEVPDDTEPDELVEQLLPWEVPSFMVMPGVDDARVEESSRSPSKRGRAGQRKSPSGAISNSGESRRPGPKGGRSSVNKLRDETRQIVPEIETGSAEEAGGLDAVDVATNIEEPYSASSASSENFSIPAAAVAEAPTLIPVSLEKLNEQEEAIPQVSTRPDIYQLATTDVQAWLVAAWEVTRFIWPEVCDRLDKTACLRDVGEKLRSAAANGLKALAVTSTHRGEGTTTVAICLARSAATAGMRVALLDADCDHPRLATVLGVDAVFSWDEALLQNLPLSESAVASNDDGVTLFPRLRELSAELALSDPRVADMVQQLIEQFDIVIVDVGTLPNTTQQFFVRGGRERASPIHGTAVVRDVRSTSSEQTNATVGRLRTFGVEQVAIVENFGVGG